MREEVYSLNRQNVWRLVQLLKNRSAISVKWTYDIKLNKDNKIERFKARIVGKGFMWSQGLNFDELYSPVSKYSTFRLLLSLIAPHGWERRSLDIIKAFLNAPLDQELYVEQSDEFVLFGKEDHVYPSLEVLYRLRQASCLWHQHFQKFLLSIGFKKTYADTSLYTKTLDGNTTIILVYVDDLLLTGSSSNQLNAVVQDIAGSYEVRIGNAYSKFFRMVVEEPNRGNIFLHNRPAVDELLERFGMLNCNPASTPLTTGFGSLKHFGNMIGNIKHYQKLVGCLMYFANKARSDTAYATNLLTKYLKEPLDDHWVAGKHILRYLEGTTNSGISYSSKRNKKIVGYCNSD